MTHIGTKRMMNLFIAEIFLVEVHNCTLGLFCKKDNSDYYYITTCRIATLNTLSNRFDIVFSTGIPFLYTTSLVLKYPLMLILKVPVTSWSYGD